MWSHQPRLVRSLTVLVLAAATVFVAGSAGAAPPPPPNFWNFRIQNGTPADIVGVTVKFFSHVPGQYHLINEAEPAEVMLERVPPGTGITVNLRSIYGVVRIEAWWGGAKKAYILATKNADWICDSCGYEEYAGFTPDPPTIAEGCPLEWPSYPSRLDFTVVGGARQGKLHGKSRWGCYYDATPKEQTAPYP